MALLINGVVYERPLIVFAMEAEAGEEFTDYNLLFTGIGKLNAVYHLGKKLAQETPDLIVNLGTAGSSKFSRGSIVNPTAFVQRDMDVTGLGVERYRTPFEVEPAILPYGLRTNNLEEAICGSGDSFETAHASDLYDVVDMEAFPLALISKKEAVDFLCLKYISDGAGEEAALEWKDELKLAAKRLRETLRLFELN